MYALLYLGQFDVELLLPHQSAEFRFIIVDIIVLVLLEDLSMRSRNRNVGDPYLAFVPSPDLDPVFGDVLDHHHVVRSIRHSLEDQVGPLGSLYRKQLIGYAILLDLARVFVVADLAVELLKVVLDGSSNHLLLHLRLVPLLQAAKVNESTGSTAFAGLAEEFSELGALSEHAVLALERFVLCGGFERRHNNFFLIFPELGASFSFVSGAVIECGYYILDSSEFDDLSWT